jgi:predicted acetyltransferase
VERGAEQGSAVALDPIARDQAPVLESLFQLYAHDFSEHVPLALEPNGRFDVAIADRWWAGDGHFPFFLRSNGRLCGFALVERGSRITDASDVMDVAEFFVVRGARGKRTGTTAAHALFTAFPGRWEVRCRRSNVAARAFWSRAVGSWTSRPATSVPFSSEGVDWDVFQIPG